MSELNGPNFSVNQVNFRGIQKQSVETTPDTYGLGKGKDIK